MIYHAIQIVLMFCTDLLILWTYLRILTFRSKPLFCVIYVIQFSIDVAIRELGVPTSIRSSIAVPLLSFCIPILLSRDRLSVSFTRTLAVNTIMIFTELIGSSVYALLTHGQMLPGDIGPDTILPVILVYAIIFSAAAPLFQILIALCNRIDGVDDLNLQMPIILLLTISFIQFMVNYLRFCTISDSLVYAFTTLTFCWLSVLITYLIFASVTSEFHARRELAQHAMTARQARHERIEIEAIAKKAAALYELRHSLANQMRGIIGLATSGNEEEAASRLLDLQNQAHFLAGDHND